MNKKILAAILSVSLASAAVLSGCGGAPQGQTQDQTQEETTQETAEPAPAPETAEPVPAQEPPQAEPEEPVVPGEAPAQEGDDEVVVGEEPGTGNDQAEGEGREPGSDNGILVVYFSRTGEQYGVGTIDKGNTAIIAEMIAEDLGADLYEIKPAQDNYPTTYDALTDVAKREQNENARPAYTDTVPDLSYYSTIFVGAPVWWGDWPMIMYTFFENEDLAGKILIPFCTHAGSGLSDFDRKLAAACPDSTVADGLAILGEDAQNDQEEVLGQVRYWLSELGY